METGEEIEKALSVLIGQPFWKASRATDMEMLHFGERHPSTTKKGAPIEYGEYALHIQCAWRITHLDEIVVGRNDLYYPPDGSFEFPEGVKWNIDLKNMRDVRMKAFMQEHADSPLVVTSIEAHRAGAVSIFFTGDYVLELFPDNSSNGYKEDNNMEEWRFMNGRNDHFVVMANGIQGQNE